MNVIGISWAQEVLRRYWKVPAATALAPTLGTEVVPTFDLAQLAIELRTLGGEIPCLGYGGQVAVAGEYARVSLNNNTADRLIMTEGVFIWGAAASSCRFRVQSAAGTTGGVTGVRDGRIGSGRTLAIVGQNSAAAQIVTSNYGVLNYPLNAPFFYPIEAVLPPGVTGGIGLVFENSTVNQNINVTYLYRERLVSPAGYEVTGL